MCLRWKSLEMCCLWWLELRSVWDSWWFYCYCGVLPADTELSQLPRHISTVVGLTPSTSTTHKPSHGFIWWAALKKSLTVKEQLTVQIDKINNHKIQTLEWFYSHFCYLYSPCVNATSQVYFFWHVSNCFRPINGIHNNNEPWDYKITLIFFPKVYAFLFNLNFIFMTGFCDSVCVFFTVEITGSLLNPFDCHCVDKIFCWMDI